MSFTFRSFAARSRVWLLVVALVVGFTVRAEAHDFWIQPSSFRPQPGSRVSLDLRVGTHFQGEAVARNPERIERFFARVADAADLPIAGVDGRAPAGYWSPATAGLTWIGYHSRPSSLELAAGKFESYLAEEGLERVIELRKLRGESQSPGRERYSRCAKSLIQVGGSESKESRAHEIKLGFPLEIFPEQNPYALRVGDAFTVRLYNLDQPLEGALVGCMAQSDPKAEVRVRTDAEGRARFTLAQNGVWLVRAVHMVRVPAGEVADWDSLWASLTFELH